MRILIADDHQLFLKGLEFVLKEAFPDAALMSADSYTSVFEILTADKNFDLILTDLAMPGASWLNALQKIHDLMPETPIIILSAVFDPEIVHKTIELGAAGYIPKTSPNAKIIGAVQLVLSGGIYIPSELLKETRRDEFDILKQVEDLPDEEDRVANSKILTPRQIDVISLISKGLANKQIAYELGLTEGTVKLHVTAILKLLNVSNRTAAVMEAGRLGLIKNNE